MLSCRVRLVLSPFLAFSVGCSLCFGLGAHDYSLLPFFSHSAQTNAMIHFFFKKKRSKITHTVEKTRAKPRLDRFSFIRLGEQFLNTFLVVFKLIARISEYYVRRRIETCRHSRMENNQYISGWAWSNCVIVRRHHTEIYRLRSPCRNVCHSQPEKTVIS